mgnify:CR=1 FL=1
MSSNKTENKKNPYFIFKPKVLEKNYKEFEKLSQKYLEKYVISYSVKTNSFDNVIEILDRLGSSFEVASLNEIELVNKIIKNNQINLSNDRQGALINKNKIDLSKNHDININNKLTDNRLIVFNGPCKTEDELKIAIDNKFLINADSLSEINKIIKILEGKKFDIGLRVSLEESKFGFQLEMLEETINYCKKNNLNVICLSFHSGTKLNINDYKKFIENIDKIISYFKNNVNLKYIDLGGGFPDSYQLKNLGVNLKDYFKLMDKLKKFNLTIILEPGRVLVSDAFDLITKVNVIKQNFGKNYAILDAGINILSKIALANYKFSKIENIDNINKDIYVNDIVNQTREINSQLSMRSSSSKNLTTNVKDKKEYVLAGPLLFKNDILGKFFGNLKENDLIKIENVGAYCYNLAWEISYKKPKIFMGE